MNKYTKLDFFFPSLIVERIVCSTGETKDIQHLNVVSIVWTPCSYNCPQIMLLDWFLAQATLSLSQAWRV